MARHHEGFIRQWRRDRRTKQGCTMAPKPGVLIATGEVRPRYRISYTYRHATARRRSQGPASYRYGVDSRPRKGGPRIWVLVARTKSIQRLTALELTQGGPWGLGAWLGPFGHSGPLHACHAFARGARRKREGALVRNNRAPSRAAGPRTPMSIKNKKAPTF